MHYGSFVAAVAALLLGGVSCEKILPEEGDNQYKAVDLSTRSRELVKEGHAFSFEFIDRINDTAKTDYVVSPLSMQFLLGMLLEGAQGATEAEICEVLGYGAGEKRAVNEYCLSMLSQLPKLDAKTDLSIANAIYVDKGYPLKTAYKKAMTKYYKAEVSNLDFSDVERSTKIINKWCSDNTNGLIPEVIEEVSPDMLAYLLDALYFKSQWKNKFNKDFTIGEPFVDESGQRSEVKMMKGMGQYNYAENEKFQAVRLPYGNGAFSMTVLLPRGGFKVSDITAMLKDPAGRKTLDNMGSFEVDLWLPKFETKFSMELNAILSKMGMPLAFDTAADFKAMSDYAMRLSFVKQDAIIKVDEEGTEAAAVSSAGVEKATSVGPSKSVTFHADHPFLYLITETSTGAVLFAGRYAGK